MILPFRSHPKELYKGQVRDHNDTHCLEFFQRTSHGFHPIDGVLRIPISKAIDCQKFILTGSW